MHKIMLLWLAVFIFAGGALATASQYLITPVWLSNVLAAFYLIKFRREFSHPLVAALLPFSSILLASVLFDDHQRFITQVILALLSALQVMIFIWIYYGLIKHITKIQYKRTVLLTVPNLVSSFVCAALFTFIPEMGVRSLIFFDYFLEQVATGFSLVCLLYGFTTCKKIQIKDYGLISATLVAQYFMSVSQIFSHAFILPFVQVYLTIQYHFRSFVFLMGLMGVICSIYLTLPLAGQYWNKDQLYVFAHLSTYRVGIASFTVVFLLLSELQMHHRSLSRYLEKVSFYDELTRLKNRRYLREKVLHNNNNLKNGAVLLVDLDNFKKVNDQYGHNVGDEVLKFMAQRLQEALKIPNVIFRWGGEEFLILLKDIQDEVILKQQCQEIIQHCKTDFQMGNITISCSMSMGVKAYATLTLDNYHKAIDRADQMLYQAKANGKQCYILDDVKL